MAVCYRADTVRWYQSFLQGVNEKKHNESLSPSCFPARSLPHALPLLFPSKESRLGSAQDLLSIPIAFNL